MLNLYYIANSGLQTGNQAMNIISNNIANSINYNYSRQNITLSSIEKGITSTNYFSNGVRVEGIVRALDEYANKQVLATETLLQASNTHYSRMNLLELEFNKIDDGIHTKLNKLFKMLQDISKEPINGNYRISAFIAIKDLTSYLNQLSNNLIRQEQKNYQDMKQSIANINQLAGQIANLNQEISNKQNIDSSSAYNLLDRRDALLQTLNQQIGINTQVRTKTAAINVILNNGHILVNGDKENPLEITTDKNNPWNRKIIFYRDINNTVIPLQDNLLNKGVLGGLMAFNNNDLPKIYNWVNELALYLSNRFNTVNRQGYDIKGQRGKNIFSYELPSAIANVKNKGKAILSVTALNTDPSIAIKIAQPQEYNLLFKEDHWRINITNSNREVKFTMVNNQLIFDGITISINGNPQEGDSYQLNPFNGIASSLKINIKSGNEIAAGRGKKLQNTYIREAGNNTNIIALSKIQHEKLINGITINNFCAAMTGYIGITNRNLIEKINSQEKAFQDAYLERSKKIGVDLNREYIQMEMFRQYYNASIQVLRTANLLLDTLLAIH